MKRGMSSVLSSVLIMMVIVVAIAIIGVIVLNTTNKIGESVSVKECAFSSPNDVSGYNTCLTKNLGARAQVYTLNESTSTIKNGVIYSLTNSSNNTQNSTNIINNPKNCYTNITNGLVGYYCFENNANDSSGLNNNGIENAHLTYLSIFNNSYIKLNGGRDSVGVNLSDSLKFTEYTYIAWLNPNSTVRTEVSPIVNIGGRTGTGYYWTDPGHYFMLTRVNYSAPWDLRMVHYLGNSWGCGPGKFPNDDKWHQIALRFNSNGIIEYYLDGNFIGNANCNKQLPIDSLSMNTNYRFMIGAMDGTYSYGYYGSMDNVMLYNRTLNTNEISSIYNEQKDNFVLSQDNIFDLVGNSTLDMTKSQLYQTIYGGSYYSSLILTCKDDSKASGYYLVENQSYNIYDPCDNSYIYSIKINQVSNTTIDFEIINYNSDYDQENINNYLYFNNIDPSLLLPDTNEVEKIQFIPGLNVPFNSDVPKLK